MNKVLKKPELMCPIRDWASLEACKKYADAVYFSIDNLSLRANANSLKLKDLTKFIALCHAYKIKAYLTVNSVIYNDDLKLAEKIIVAAKRAKVDAVIVWDPAVIKLAKQYKIKFFVSTQANISNWQAAKFYQDLGASRVVLAREMTLKQIKELKKKVDLEIETFVHGAMCVAISGRCLLSAYLYGKSANCGSCGQPCRKAWLLTDDEGNQINTEGKYFLSAKDLCMIEYLPELIKAGINSFKIEGRRRDPKYIEVTARCYREAIDAYYNKNFTKNKLTNWIDQLRQVYHRGFSTGFYFGVPGQEGIGFEKSDNIGSLKKTLVGYVKKYYPKLGVASITLNHHDLKIGDRIIIEGNKTYLEQSVESMQLENKKIKLGKKGQEVAILVKQKVNEKDKIFLLK